MSKDDLKEIVNVTYITAKKEIELEFVDGFGISLYFHMDIDEAKTIGREILECVERLKNK